MDKTDAILWFRSPTCPKAVMSHECVGSVFSGHDMLPFGKFGNGSKVRHGILLLLHRDDLYGVKLDFLIFCVLMRTSLLLPFGPLKTIAAAINRILNE
ncbi:adenine glycosylase [Anopheles sinensis]|uniref:Adenine glycosylase n=1 Tax=Anopheles sinensis TaxID=74873 RepID=A0A084VPL0_ANOSI|nr:adenine glycosylase [Anopheles sinensis]